MENRTKARTLKLVVCGMMIALDVALARLASFNTTTERIGLALFTVAIVARLYGPMAAATVHGVADIIGALLFPMGAYFPGFTLSAVIVGVVYGLCYRRSIAWWRIVLAVVSTQLVCTLWLNTLWLSILFGKGFLVYLPGRLIQSAIATPVQIIGTPLLLRLVDRHIRPLLGLK